MASGVGVADECISKFQELKLGKSLRYIIYKMSEDNTQVVVESTAPSSSTYTDFVNALPKNDCRFAVYDFEFTVAEGGQRNKILFVAWSPETSKIKSKMLYTASKADLRKKLVGIGTEIQATDLSEIDHEVVLEKAARDTR